MFFLIRNAVAASLFKQPANAVPAQKILRAAAPTMAAARSFSTTPAQNKKGVTLLQDKDDGFGFARSNSRPAKPRSKGVTEIRGPYYTVRCSTTGHDTSLLTWNLGNGKALPIRYSGNVRT